MKDLFVENHFGEMVKRFKKSKSEVWHINRHAFDSVRPGAVNHRIELGVHLGLSLLKYWTECARHSKSDYIFSRPYLVIEGDWLDDNHENPPPPWVYICLAKTSEAFKPLTPSYSPDFEETSSPLLKAIDLSAFSSFYVESEFDELARCWVLVYGSGEFTI